MAYTAVIEQIIVPGNIDDAIRATVSVRENKKEIYRENVLIPAGMTDPVDIEEHIKNWSIPISNKHANHKKVEGEKASLEGKEIALDTKETEPTAL